MTRADIATTICITGYTERVRPPESQTEDFKFSKAYPAYGIAAGTTSELDHLVPLELGGANDAAKLWPDCPAPTLRVGQGTFMHCQYGGSCTRVPARAASLGWVSAVSG